MNLIFPFLMIVLMGGTVPAKDFSPTDIADCMVWLDAEQSVSQDGNVVRWENLAVPGKYDAVQNSAGARPSLLYETWPGHRAIHFDGIDDFMTLESSAEDLALAAGFSVFVVGRVTGGHFSDGSGGFLGTFMTGTGYRKGWTILARPDGEYGVRVGTGTDNLVQTPSPADSGRFVLMNGNYSDGEESGMLTFYSSLFEDPLQKPVNPGGLQTSGRDAVLGMFSGWNASVFSSAMECDIAEIIIYSRALDQEERKRVWDALESRYDLSKKSSAVVTGFGPSGYVVSPDSAIQVRFSEPMDENTITNIIVASGGLPGLPENSDWARVNGEWTPSENGTVFTFTPAEKFTAGDLILCRITTNVMSVSGVPYSPSDEEPFSFIVDNGVSYDVATHSIDPMAVVYHDNGDPHVLPMTLMVPDTGTSCPVMFWVHGGGWTGGNSGSWGKSSSGPGVMGDYLTGKLGVAVVGVAWRSSSNSEGTFAKATNDVSLAIDYIIAHADEYGLDTGRMGLYGGSAGTPTSALVSQCNTNISCYIGFNGLYNFTHRTGTGSFGQGSAFKQDVPSYEANSAALDIRRNPPDTLLLHGTADTTIECEQSVWYTQNISDAGGSAEVLLYRDEVHAFFNSGRPMYYPTMYAAGRHLIRVFKLEQQ